MTLAETTAEFRRQLGVKRPARKPKPYDHASKAELWAALQRAEKQLASVADKSETLARDAHHGTQDLTDARLRLARLREDAHAITRIARGESP